MNICPNCEKEFEFEGYDKNYRKYCYICSPKGSKGSLINRLKAELRYNENELICTKCKIKKPKDQFVKKLNKNSYYGWCKDCVNRCNKNRYKDRKQTILETLGINSCSRCGYNKYVGALHFHHINGDGKDFNLSKNHSVQNTLEEAKKCIVVCANCHHEIHYELRTGKYS